MASLRAKKKMRESRSKTEEGGKSIEDEKIIGPFLIGDCLGKGGSGGVYRALNSENGEFVAVKQMRFHSTGSSQLANFRSEMEILKNLSHPNIVRYTDFIQSEYNLNLVLELVESGSLADIIFKFGTFPEPLIVVYMSQCLDALAYLHSRGVIHRNIRGANILITKEGRVKLADFYISAIVGKTETDSDKLLVSPYWSAPEVISMSSAVTPACDIWSLGITTMELFDGAPPHFDLHQMAAAIKITQEDPPLPANISENMAAFLRNCFKKDPAARPSAKEMLLHPWIFKSQASQRGSSGKEESTSTPLVSVSSLQESIQAYNRSSSTDLVAISEVKHEPEVLVPNRLQYSFRIYVGDLSSEAPFKTLFVSPSTPASSVIALMMRKYKLENRAEYYLAEVHESGEEREVNNDEYLFKVRENWSKLRGDVKLFLRKKRDAVKQGNLKLKVSNSGGSGGSWKKFWFVLDQEERYLAYYDKPPKERNVELAKGFIYSFGQITTVQPGSFSISASLNRLRNNPPPLSFGGGVSTGGNSGGGPTSLVASDRAVSSPNLNLSTTPFATSSQSLPSASSLNSTHLIGSNSSLQSSVSTSAPGMHSSSSSSSLGGVISSSSSSSLGSVISSSSSSSNISSYYNSNLPASNGVEGSTANATANTSPNFPSQGANITPPSSLGIHCADRSGGQAASGQSTSSGIASVASSSFNPYPPASSSSSSSSSSEEDHGCDFVILIHGMKLTEAVWELRADTKAHMWDWVNDLRRVTGVRFQFGFSTEPISYHQS